MAPQFPVASISRARTKKEDPLARYFSKAEPGRRKGGAGAGIGGSRARERASSVSGGSGAGDDGHEVIVITDDEDGSDEAISVSGSVEEEEEPCDYRLQTVRRSKPKQISPKDKDVFVDDVGGDSDKEESTDFQFDDDLICCGEVRSFGERGEGNCGSFGSEGDHYAQNLPRKNTPSVTEDPEADLSSGYLTSSTECSTEADDSSDEDYVACMSESMSTERETSLSSGEYRGREENMKIRKTRIREDKGGSSCLYSASKNNKKLAIDCEDDPIIDDVGRKENAEDRVSWVNEWLLDDVEEKKEEETINVEQLNAEIACPSNDDDGYSRQMEEGGSFSLSERRGSRETEETERGGEDDDERLQEEGKAAIELDGVNAATDVSLGKEKGKMGEMEERGNFRGPEEEQLKQRRAKSTSRSKVSGVNRRMEEKIYGKHVQADSDAVIRDATSSKVEGRKERDLVMSCSSQRQQKKRKHEDCSGKKAFANGVDENDSRANWISRARKERASEPWLNKFFKLANCLWGRDELLQDDIEKENAEKQKHCGSDNTMKEERMESTECGISTKPSEEGIGAHQTEARKDSTSTRDYGIRWERSGKSNEKFRSN
ncbi:ATP-synt_DE_N domain-containing protein [Psidium guajava]|nr:ATP-synt_DE_N domain-containing protein [Psidium guajava]